MKQEGKKILITVPHACIVGEGEDPTCDVNSEKYARSLSRFLISQGHEIKTIVSGNMRKDCDNDRAECQTTSFSMGLLKALPNHHFLFDIHSTEKEGVVLATLPGVSNDLYEKLAVKIRSQGANVDVVEGSEAHFITFIAWHKYRVPAFLIKIPQNATDEEVDAVVSGIGDFVTEITPEQLEGGGHAKKWKTGDRSVPPRPKKAGCGCQKAPDLDYSVR